MLVLDVDREGIPVGFLITNCNNRAVLNNYFIILCPKSRGTHHYNDYNEWQHAELIFQKLAAVFWYFKVHVSRAEHYFIAFISESKEKER